MWLHWSFLVSSHWQSWCVSTSRWLWKEPWPACPCVWQTFLSLYFPAVSLAPMAWGCHPERNREGERGKTYLASHRQFRYPELFLSAGRASLNLVPLNAAWKRRERLPESLNARDELFPFWPLPVVLGTVSMISFCLPVIFEITMLMTEMCPAIHPWRSHNLCWLLY